jgi:general stress protein 26
MILNRGLRVGLVFTIVAAGMLAAAVPTARAKISQRDSQALAKSGLIYVATVRKDGNQSKAAPVWFTIGADHNTILIQTGRDTWKAKRIQRGSRVMVWIGTADGPAFIGRAEITSDDAVKTKILTDFRNKYWRA